MGHGPLAGLRVLDVTDDSGRFATKLLAESGAGVLRLGRGSPGPAMRAPDAAARGGLLDWWYDGGKERARLDLDDTDDRDRYRRLATHADLIVETEAPGRLAGLGLDHGDLVAENPTLVQVSLTPFGRTGPRAGWQSSDLVAAALGGVLSLSGLPDEPVNPWGRQSYNLASFLASIAGMAAVRAAPQGSLHWIGAYVVVPARTGWLMITPAPNVPGLLEWMLEAGFLEVQDLVAIPIEELVLDVPRLMKALASFAATDDATALFHQAQRRHIAFGEVLSVAQVAVNPQHEFRGFFRPVAWEGSTVELPGPVARFHGTPVAPAAPPARDEADVESIVQEWGAQAWGARGRPSGTGAPLAKPLEGLRVLDLSHVLAGALPHPHPRRPRRRHRQGADRGAGDDRQRSQPPVLLRVEPVEARRLHQHEGRARGRRRT